MLIVTCAYRVLDIWQIRPAGFTPYISMALFGGAMIKDKRLGIILPLFCLLLSEVVYETLYQNGIGHTPGFYKGQWVSYLLFAIIACFGILMKKANVIRVVGFTVSSSVFFFLASNFMVWNAGGGFGRPHTFNGLMLCYGDALAFYRDYGLIHGFIANQLIGDLFFAGVLFGGFYLLRRFALKPQLA